MGHAMSRETPSTLVSRNVVVGAKRTSLRLEPAMWKSLEEIARREAVSLHRLCTEIDARRRESSLTAAIRVFILSYFRAAATEQGHRTAGHGVVGWSAPMASDRRLRLG
jgi:predicted DNA-binding ribbon-helix-helix protein